MDSVPIVRPYEPRDRDAVIDIVRTVYDEYGFGWEPEGYHRDIHDVPRYYQGDDAAFWVAELGGKILGCGGLITFPAIPGEPGAIVDHERRFRIAGADCELVRLYVHPSARKKGLGTALLDRVISEAKRRGCKRMEIWSDKLLVDAHRMYRRYGAETLGERLCPPPDETPEWGMGLDLK